MKAVYWALRGGLGKKYKKSVVPIEKVKFKGGFTE